MKHQLTLSRLIKALAKLPAGLPFKSYASVSSYRGNYEDLALVSYGHSQHDGTVGGFLALLMKTVGTKLTGYKGGHFLMTENTLVYLVYDYGDTGPNLVDVQVITSAVTDETHVRLVGGNDDGCVSTG